MMESALRTTQGQQQYRMWQQLDRSGALDNLSSNHRQGYERVKSDINKQKADLQILHDQFRNGHQLLGSIFSASGFKRKNIGVGKNGENYFTNLDWALARVNPARQPSNEVCARSFFSKRRRDGTYPLRYPLFYPSPLPFDFYPLTIILLL